jgi:hypothetical protein
MSLAAIRAKLQAQENRGQSTPSTKVAGDSALYPFWNIKAGETATIRFIPDADPSNSFFWVEKAVINLTFQGVKGQNDNKEYTVKVPCMEMYGDNCAVLAEVRTWYKDDSLKEMANKYWKKRTYLFQGFVNQNPLLNTGNPKTEDSPPENPIRRFVITPQVFTIIKSSLMDPEIEELPTDYLRGLDFKIVKTTKGDYADYSTSGWARKETALTEVQQAAIEQYGLYDLKTFLPKKPSESEQRVIKEMFEASVDGRPYDVERWGAYYKPWGIDAGTATKSDDSDEFSTPAPRAAAPALAPQAAPVAEAQTASWDNEEPAPAQEVKVPETAAKANATDILAMIRNRQGKTA